MKTFLIKRGTLVRTTGEEVVDVLIEDGIIKTISTAGLQATDYQLQAHQVIDATGKLIMPGLIDCHVHFREPGLEHKATMASESAAALAGGVTAVCEMPNTKPPTVTIAALADKVRRAENIKRLDMRFFFGATKPEHLHALRELLTGDSAELRRLRARCCGLKLYFDHSTGNQGADHHVITDAFKLCAEHNFPIVAHCEDPQMNAEAAEKFRNDVAIQPEIARHSLMRPPEAEEKAIRDAIALSKEFGTHLHVAHLSTRLGLELVRKAKKDGLHVTCEVAPHHLFLTMDDYQALGTLAKMNPPLRSKDDQEALWHGINDGTVDCIATDHAPHTMEEKTDANPLDAPSGVPGVETMLPLLMAAASGESPRSGGRTSDSGLRCSDIVRLCFENPNRIFNLEKKGITEGAPADLILVDLKAEWTIHGKELHSKCGWTPYEGWKVRGKVVSL